jgi:hypothetical protein
VDPTLTPASNGLGAVETPASRGRGRPARDESSEPPAGDVDDEDAGESGAVVVESAADHLIAEFFPGAQEIG